MPVKTRSKQMERFMAAYARLEQGVRERMEWICTASCSTCISPCCRVVFCRESFESPFLSAMTRRVSHPIHWAEEKGWLTPTGCGLPMGRPPVCYEFYCPPIADTQVTTEAAYALSVLSALMGFVGRNAYGRRHLVELNDLAHLNLDRLENQCGTAMQVLAHLADFWESPGSRCLDRDLCARVRRPTKTMAGCQASMD